MSAASWALAAVVLKKNRNFEAGFLASGNLKI